MRAGGAGHPPHGEPLELLAQVRRGLGSRAHLKRRISLVPGMGDMVKDAGMLSQRGGGLRSLMLLLHEAVIEGMAEDGIFLFSEVRTLHVFVFPHIIFSENR